MGANCEHLWASNKGKGGIPLFELSKVNPGIAGKTMPSTCSLCGLKTIFSAQVWIRLANTTTYRKGA